MRAHHRIGLILLALVLVPTLGYVAYEANALNANEALLESIYTQQLDDLLFSVNQYAFTVTDSWAQELTGDLQKAQLDGRPLEAALDSALARDDALVGVFITDTTLQRTTATGVDADAGPPFDTAFVRRLLDRYRVGYRQLAPSTLWVDGTTARTDRIALAFVGSTPLPALGDAPYVAGFILDVPSFINDVLGPKMATVGRGTFVLSVADTAGTVVYRTEGMRDADDPLDVAAAPPSPNGRARSGAPSLSDSTAAVVPVADIARKRLWILPAHTVGIGVPGEGIGATLQRRFRRNLLMIGLLGLLLLGAAVFAYRSVEQEIELARVRARLVSNVSHELRTPLALIRMYAETLEAGRVPDKRRPEYLGVIARESERLSRLIDTLLNFSRIEAGRERFDLAPTDLNALARDVTARFALPAERDGFTIETAFSDTMPTVEADAEALTEALVNLVDNALKYSRPHPDARRVAIRTGVHRNGSRKPQAFVEVEDDGPGIAVAHQRQVFEPFFRVGDDARDDLVHETKGTGLGLALVARIAEAHGGRIDLHSAPGDGARFRLLLPLASEPPA
ncbi:MAG: HAMP domain-containing sensor histidine kinase [Bacteroidota bacterium]